jgi:hypothetical protein
VVAIEIEHVVLAAGVFFGEVSDYLPEAVAHHRDFSEVELAIEGVVGGLGLDDDDAGLRGVGRHHAVAVLFVAESMGSYLISMPVWYPPSPRQERQELKSVKS